MTTLVARIAAIAVLACLIGACTSVGDIQRQTPVRTMKFSGDPQLVARCAHERLGGKLRSDGYDRQVIYDSVKSRQSEGITHYAVTFGKGENGGFAELRILRPPRAPGPGVPPAPRPSAALIAEYWNPVVQCTKPAV